MKLSNRQNLQEGYLLSGKTSSLVSYVLGRSFLQSNLTGTVLPECGSNLHELNPIPRHDGLAVTKSPIHLKHVFGGMLGGDLGLGVGCRVFSDTDDGIVRIDVDDIEGEGGVFHPKGKQLFLWKEEQHTAELWQLIAIHEAEPAFFWGVDDFDCDVDGFAILGVNDDVGRRGRGGRAGREDGQQQKDKCTRAGEAPWLHFFVISIP